MFNSLRWSLQLWHAGLLALVLAGFGAASYYGIRQARYQEIDAQLVHSVQSLAAGLHYPPPPWRDFPNGGRGSGPQRHNEDGNHPPWTGRGPQDHGPQDHGPQDHGPQNHGPQDGNANNPNGPPPDGGRGGPDDHNGPGFRDDQPRQLELPPALAQQFGNGEEGSIYYFIWDYDRQTTKTSRPTADIPDPAPPPTPRQGPPMGPLFSPEPPIIRQRDDLREAYINGPAGTRLLVGKSVVMDEAQLRRSAWLLCASGMGVLLIGLAGGWLLSFRAVRPIHAITATAQEISASNLSKRIDVAGTQSELGTLAAVLNDTFTRLESAFGQQVRFTADASHELRTPLAVIHTNAQLALSRERTAEEYRKTLETCLRASTRMKGLVDSLLVLAKADAGRLSLERTLFDLRDIVEESVAMVTPLAQDKKITLEPHTQSVELSADPSRVAQVVTNLLSNAIRYNREGGSVKISTRVNGKDAVLTIADTGIGIPPENQPHLFERFYRVDPARSRELGGSGLGLAICKSIIEAHGGTIAFTSEPGQGSTFTVRLPLVPTAALTKN